MTPQRPCHRRRKRPDRHLGILDQRKNAHHALPVGAVLTISAAGSESSDSAVLTNLATGVKRGLGTELNRPRFAIMNPELTMTLPPYQVACGVTDIMMHTMDRYFNPLENELTDAIAEALLQHRHRPGTYCCKES